jgi:hypothetical protein
MAILAVFISNLLGTLPQNIRKCRTKDIGQKYPVFAALFRRPVPFCVTPVPLACLPEAGNVVS